MSAPDWAAAFNAGDPEVIGSKVYEAMNAGVQSTHDGIREYPPWNEAEESEKAIYVAAGQWLQGQGLLKVTGE
jgi:hypothetical protein